MRICLTLARPVALRLIPHHILAHFKPSLSRLRQTRVEVILGGTPPGDASGPSLVAGARVRDVAFLFMGTHKFRAPGTSAGGD